MTNETRLVPGSTTTSRFTVSPGFFWSGVCAVDKGSSEMFVAFSARERVSCCCLTKKIVIGIAMRIIMINPIRSSFFLDIQNKPNPIGGISSFHRRAYLIVVSSYPVYWGELSDVTQFNYRVLTRKLAYHRISNTIVRVITYG